MPIRLILALTCLWFSSLGFAAPPPPPTVAAKAHLLMDYHSHRVLSEDNADQRVEPASLTKMLTAYVVFNELKQGHIGLDDQVRVSEKAWRMEGSRMFIEVDKLVSVEDLLKGLIIQSGNDASVALAEHVAGSEEAFVGLMNQTAARLGMRASHFVNCTGLPDPDHYTTARDLAVLAMHMIRDFPEHYAWHAIKKFTFNKIPQYNRNRLLWQDESVDGIKTGHTKSAGYCLVASARRGEMRLISVVMGTKSEKARTTESRKLLNYGFRFFETHPLYQAQQPLYRVRVWKGAREQLPVGLEHDLYVTIPLGQSKGLDATMHLDREVMAPVVEGQRIGVVRVTVAGQPLEERPLVALQTVEEGGIWTQIVDEVKLMFE